MKFKLFILTLSFAVLFYGCASKTIQLSVIQDDCPTVKSFIAQKGGVNAVDSGNVTALMWTTFYSKWDCAISLLNSGADPNIQNIYGRTPLFWAARNGNVDVAKALIQHGAVVEKKDSEGDTPFLYASYGNSVEMLKMLADNGADVHASDNNRDNALMDTSISVANALTTVNSYYKNNPQMKEYYAKQIDGYKDTWDFLVSKGVSPYDLDVYGRSAVSMLADYPAYKTRFLGEPKPAPVVQAPKPQAVPSDAAAKVKELEEKQDVAGMEAYLDTNPDAIELIKGDDFRLSMYGPSKLRVLNIQEYLKNGMGEKLIIAQINASKKPYKIFSPDEVLFLQKQGIPEDVIAAMITRTAQLEDAKEKTQAAQPVVQQQIIVQQADTSQQTQQDQPQQQTAGQAAAQEATNQVVHQGVKMLFDHFNPFK